MKLPANFFQKQHKSGVLHLPLEYEVHLVTVGSGKIRREFASANGLFKNQIHALAGTLHEPAPGKDIRDASISRILPVQDVFKGDAVRKTARAFDFEVTGILAYKHISPMPVISMAHRIENGFPDGSLFSGGINECMGSWFDLRFFKYEIIHKKWQYHLFGMLKSYFNSSEVDKLIDELWKKYPKGLVANVSKGNVPETCGGLARYLAKYVASPPIALRRIISYDGQDVTYWCNDHMTKARKVETVEADVFIGRMVQLIMPKELQRVRYYGLQATKTFKKWSEVIRKGMKALGRSFKGTYQFVKAKRYRERYMEISSQDPFLCWYCGHEMVLWKIWHPKYGVLYDEYENIKADKYGTVPGQEDSGGSRCPLWASSRRIQLPLFPLPV